MHGLQRSTRKASTRIQKNRNMVRQSNQNLQDKLLESETKVANLTAKLGTAIKCIEERDKTIVFRDAKIKSLTYKRDELHGLLAIQKAARASDRDKDTYLEKVPQQSSTRMVPVCPIGGASH